MTDLTDTASPPADSYQLVVTEQVGLMEHAHPADTHLNMYGSRGEVQQVPLKALLDYVAQAWDRHQQFMAASVPAAQLEIVGDAGHGTEG